MHKETQSGNLSSHYRGFPSAALHTIGHAKEIVEKPSGEDNKTRLMGIFFSGNYSWNNIFLAMRRFVLTVLLSSGLNHNGDLSGLWVPELMCIILNL